MSVIVSVIIPTYNEEKYIASCLDSILYCDFPIEQIEIFVIDGMSKDNTRKILSEYEDKYLQIHVLDNQHKIVPYALNKGILASKGEYIIRMDAHSVYPVNYISELLKKHVELGADNVGASWQILPANTSIMARAIAHTSGSVFGVGNAHYRIESNEVSQVDTVPFGCYKRSVFDEIGLFDTDLVRNQDDEFNARLVQNGGKIFLLPYLKIKYSARPNLRKISKMFFQYALFKPLVNKKLKHPSSVRQFVPLFFVLYLIALMISIGVNFYPLIVVIPLLLYVLINLFFSIKLAIGKKDILSLLMMPIVFFLIHISYGVGYILGIMKYRIF